MRQTKQRGVDVILNSTNGEALRQTWYCIAPFGRFLEVGKRDIIMNTGLDMTPFLRNVGYFGVHIDQMVGPERRKVSEAMQKVFDLLNEGKIGEVHPVTVMTYTDMERGFRMVQVSHGLLAGLYETPETLQTNESCCIGGQTYRKGRTDSI